MLDHCWSIFSLDLKVSISFYMYLRRKSTRMDKFRKARQWCIMEGGSTIVRSNSGFVRTETDGAIYNQSLLNEGIKFILLRIKNLKVDETTLLLLKILQVKWDSIKSEIWSILKDGFIPCICVTERTLKKKRLKIILLLNKLYENNTFWKSLQVLIENDRFIVDKDDNTWHFPLIKKPERYCRPDRMNYINFKFL